MMTAMKLHLQKSPKIVVHPDSSALAGAFELLRTQVDAGVTETKALLSAEVSTLRSEVGELRKELRGGIEAVLGHMTQPGRHILPLGAGQVAPLQLLGPAPAGPSNAAFLALPWHAPQHGGGSAGDAPATTPSIGGSAPQLAPTASAGAARGTVVVDPATDSYRPSFLSAFDKQHRPIEALWCALLLIPKSASDLL